MKLTPKVIRHLNNAAREYGEDAFFGVWSAEGEFFVFNWVFGLRFLPGEVMDCPHVRALEEETDRVCAQSEVYKDIIRHMFHRSWMDILIGLGIYQDTELVKLKNDEEHIFKRRGWRVIPFKTDNGRRFYIKEGYFDVAEESIGEEIVPVIFRPIISRNYPGDYRPMLFRDGTGEVRGLVRAISEENMRNPVDREKEYASYVEANMPEMFG